MARTRHCKKCFRVWGPFTDKREDSEVDESFKRVVFAVIELSCQAEAVRAVGNEPPFWWAATGTV